MPSDLPFAPVIASVTGKSVYIAAVSTSSNSTTLVSTGGFAPSILVTSLATVTLFVRMTREATPVATSLDVPLEPGASFIMANPNPTGVTGLAAAGIGQGAGQVVFTPGIAGLN